MSSQEEFEFKMPMVKIFDDTVCRDSDSGFACGYCPKCSLIASLYAEQIMMKQAKPANAACRRSLINQWRVNNFKWCTDAQRRYKTERAAIKQQINLDEMQPYTWCKIGLPKGYDLKKMVETMEKLQSSKIYGMGQSLANYEYHSEQSPEGGNLHIHVVALGKCPYKKGQLAKNLAKKFGTAANCVEVEIRGDGGDFENRVNYTMGRKGHGKDIFVDRDRKWREFHGIPNVSNSFPSGHHEKFIELE